MTEQTKRKRRSKKQRKQCVRIKKDGEQCRAWAMVGTTVCGKHGGMAPQIRNKAEREQLEKKLWTANLSTTRGQDAHPLQHLLDELHTSANVVAVLSMQVEELGDITQWGQHERSVNVLYKLWSEERDRHAKLAKLCLDSGIAERQIQLVEKQADDFSRALRAILRELGVDVDSPETGKVVRKHMLELMEGTE